MSQTPQQREDTPVQNERRWYGWQNLALDGSAAALGIAALALESSYPPANESLVQGLLVGGGLVYLAGGPSMHLLHEQPWHALGSFGLRGGLTVAGGALGLALATCPPPGGTDYGSCGLGELILGAAAGSVVAMALDDGLLAWEKPAPDAASRARLGFAPVLSADGRRELRVFGTF